MTTTAVLSAMEREVSVDATFDELRSAGTTWVSRMEDMVKVHNNTPKALTGYTPKEVHFPEVRED